MAESAPRCCSDFSLLCVGPEYHPSCAPDSGSAAMRDPMVPSLRRGRENTGKADELAFVWPMLSFSTLRFRLVSHPHQKRKGFSLIEEIRERIGISLPSQMRKCNRKWFAGCDKMQGTSNAKAFLLYWSNVFLRAATHWAPSPPSSRRSLTPL